jgi:hypothetical protein
MEPPARPASSLHPAQLLGGALGECKAAAAIRPSLQVCLRHTPSPSAGPTTRRQCSPGLSPASPVRGAAYSSERLRPADFGASCGSASGVVRAPASGVLRLSK